MPCHAVLLLQTSHLFGLMDTSEQKIRPTPPKRVVVVGFGMVRYWTVRLQVSMLNTEFEYL